MYIPCILILRKFFIPTDAQMTSLKNVNIKQTRYRPEVPRGFQEVKVPRYHDNSTGWW